MKFKDYLAEAGDAKLIKKWWEDLDLECVILVIGDDSKQYDHPTFTKDDLQKARKIEVMPLGKSAVKFYWPFGELPTLKDLELGTNFRGASQFVIGFEALPKTIKNLSFLVATIESFSGIEKLHQLESIEINQVTEIKATNYLTILKCKSLKHIFMLTGAGYNKPFTFFKYKFDDGVRDIAEMADELIDTGLEEYAKL